MNCTHLFIEEHPKIETTYQEGYEINHIPQLIDRRVTQNLKDISQINIQLRILKKALKIFTSVREKEYACYTEEKQQVLIFILSMHNSPWRRGTNENANDLLREFFPKRIDSTKMTHQKLSQALWLMNDRPRKYLDYRTPL